MLENGAMAAHDSPRPKSHLVQFYGCAPDVLVSNVADFIEEGLRNDESVLVIAGSEHADAFLNALAKRRGTDRRSRRLIFLDAENTLDQIMFDGQPDWKRFEQVVGGTVRTLRAGRADGGLRAYGEMVGILWAAGKVEAAIQLERFWNVLLGGDDFPLFCGYPIDIFADEFHAERVHEVLCAHTHALPAGTLSSLEAALSRAISEVLGNESGLAEGVGFANHPSWGLIPAVEATILRLRDQRPDYAGEILSRARTYYRATA